MINFFVNIDNTPDPATILAKRDTYGGTQTLFLVFCLRATGIHRLIDKEAISEFLYRLAVIFRSYKIVPNFFTDDSLINFKYRGKYFELAIADIVEHFGMEISNSPYNMVQREEWLAQVGTYWKNACICAAVCNAPMIDAKDVGPKTFKIGANKPQFDDAYGKEAAEIFMKETMKTIGEESFITLEQRTVKMKVKLNKKRVFMQTKPKHVFNYSEIPIGIKKRFFRLIAGSPASKLKKDFEEVVNDETSYMGSLIHLAWLWANGYVKVIEIKWEGKISHTAEVDPRVPFEYDWFEGLNKLGIGINIYDTYYDYQLFRLSHLLKVEEKNEPLPF